MFKKKKKKQTNFDEEIIVALSNDEMKHEKKEEIEDIDLIEETEVIQDVQDNDEEIIVALSKDEIKQEYKEETEEIDEIQEVDEVQEIDEIQETEELVVGDFTFYDNDPSSDCAVDEDEQEKIVESEVTEGEVDDEDDKKELSSFFEKSKKDNSKIKEKPVKEKKKSKRQLKKETEFSNIKDQKVFIFRNKKYFKVEDFIKYLNDHYLEIDEISQEVLDNENFYGWLSKKSGVFDDSLKQFKEIKEKIEKK